MPPQASPAHDSAAMDLDGTRYVSDASACAQTGLAREDLLVLCHQGKIRAKRLGSRWYVDPRSLQEFLSAQEPERDALPHATGSETSGGGARSSNPARALPLVAALLVLVLASGAAATHAAPRARAAFASAAASLDHAIAALPLTRPLTASVATTLSPGPAPAPLSEAATTSASAAATTSAAPALSPTTIVKEPIVDAYIIKTVQVPTIATTSFVTQDELAQDLAALQATIPANAYSAAASVPLGGGAPNTIALASAIDQLSGTALTNPSITGGSIQNTALSGGPVSATSLSVSGDTALSGDLTVAGTFSAGSGSFAAASSTGIEATNATTTNATSTNLFSSMADFTNGVVGTLAATLANISGITVAYSTTTYATTTDAYVSDLVAGDATATNATSTNAYASSLVAGSATSSSFAITSISSSLLETDASGTVVPAIAGSDYVATTTGDWAGTLDGQPGTFYVANSFSTTSASYFLATQTTDDLAEGASNLYWTNARFDARLAATTSLPGITTLADLAAVGTISSGIWNGSVIGAQYGGTGASSFGQGWIYSSGGTGALAASTSPTVNYVSATSTTATSTFAGGFVAGASGLVYDWTTGFTGVGTANPSRLFNVFGTSANPQERISYSGSAYTELQTDAAGDFLMAPSSGIVEVANGNLEICSNSICATPTVAISGTGNLTVDNRLVAGSIEEACPTGYIWVPGESKYGTLPGFCTMKYDASDSSGTAVSSASGVPWVSISQTSAIAQCDALGPGYHLMSDQEWMTIADETTALPINDLTGSQDFANGMSDSNVSSAQSAGDAGTDPVVSGCNFMEPLSNSANAFASGVCEERGDGTGGTTDADKGFYATGSDFTSALYSAGAAGPAQLRTKILPDGAVIWDFGGNVWEWTDATIYETNTAGATSTSEEPDAGGWTASGWQEYTAITNYKGLSYIRPDITTWSSTNGIGEIYLQSGTPGFYAFIRGGNWNAGVDDGPFTLNLSLAPSNTYGGVGFRCSR